MDGHLLTVVIRGRMSKQALAFLVYIPSVSGPFPYDLLKGPVSNRITHGLGLQHKNLRGQCPVQSMALNYKTDQEPAQGGPLGRGKSENLLHVKQMSGVL